MRNSIFALVAAVALSGCVDVKPIGPTPTPGPTPIPTPDTATRRAVADSLSDVPKDECVKLYGVFTALSDYVRDGSPDVQSTGQMLQLTQRTLANLAWAKGRYPRLAETVKTELNTRFKQPKPMDGARAEVVAAFTEIAAGCRDAGRRK